MSGLILGFTGTQQGMILHQKRAFWRFLAGLSIPLTEFHHGDCVGADAEAHTIVQLLFEGCVIVIHPPENDAKRAFCKGGVVLPAKPYLDRNRDIVNACDLLIAAPKTSTEEVRSGTWATVRYARKTGKKVSFLVPEEKHYASR